MELSAQTLESHAQTLKALSHPLRLLIVYNLVHNGCHNVSCMEAHTGQSQSSISQHLARLKAAGIVKSERQGNEVYYHIASPKMQALVALLFEEQEAQP